jgi:DNA-binding IscR family transcriptional regulator
MKLISREMEVALNALQVLARHNETPVLKGVLAATLGESEAFVHVTLAKLRAANLVTGTRGPGGGWSIAPQALELSFEDFLQVFERKTGPNPLRAKHCASERASTFLAKTFAKLKLATLIK